MTEIVAAHLERFIKIARQVAHDYDVWCEHIDDPDIEKLEEMLAAALAACAREERLTAIQDAIQAFEGEYCNHEQPLVGVVRGVKAMCALKFEAERAVGEKAGQR